MTFKYTRCNILQGAGCNTDHYPVIAKVRERLSVRKQAAQNVDVERFYVKGSRLNCSGYMIQTKVT
jgi:hypothetical protein